MNSEQAAYWSDHGRYWVTHADKYDAQLAPFLPPLIEAAGVAAGDGVLDVGCGCGAPTLAAGRAVGETGRALGADLSEPMLAFARERAATEGLTWVRFAVADAQSDRFDGEPFDAVISRFGVMFFADPAAAFANLARALGGGGRLAFTCFRTAAENPWMTVPRGALAAFADLAPPPPNGPGPFSLADPDLLRRLLAGAGLRADLAPLDVEVNLGGGGDLDSTVAFVAGGGLVRDTMATFDEPTRVEALAAMRRSLEPYAGRDGVRLPAAAWLVTAWPG